MNDEVAVVDAKHWYESMAVWGGLLAMVSPLVDLVGYRLENVDALAELLGAVGGVIAVYGRVRATKPIRRLR